MLKSAVERQLTIIGEAINKLRRETPDLSGQIGEAVKIIAFRNVIVHGYDIISDQMVWNIASTKLKNLIEDFTKIIDK